DLRHNKLTSLSREALEPLESLTVLYLNGNLLRTLPPQAFPPLPRLRTLSLARNRLRSVAPAAFDALPALRHLKLNANRLVSIEAGSFVGLSQLVSLDLQHNKLTQLDQHLLQHLTRLHYVLRIMIITDGLLVAQRPIGGGCLLQVPGRLRPVRGSATRAGVRATRRRHLLPRPPPGKPPPAGQGWEYSAALFVGGYALALTFVCLAYWRMLRVIRSSGLALRSTRERRERAVAQRVALIVLTDCACWAPVMATQLLALAGVRVPQSLYAWLAVCVMPVNSALNPVLYTLTTHMFKQQVRHMGSAIV
ncbi:Toll-like receptor Tollo, partial [Gryllus bimaculatus]